MSDLKELGIALRAYRLAAGETVEELADALELETELTKLIEAGAAKPSGGIIELLSRHYALREHEANRLLELAGLKSEDFKINLESGDIDLEKLDKEFDVLISPVFYTDDVNVVTSQFGMTLNFIQSGASGDTNDKSVIISRVGMSYKHAENIVRILNENLKKARNQLDDDAANPTEKSE